MDRNDAESRRQAEARRVRLRGLMDDLNDAVASADEAEPVAWTAGLSRTADELLVALEDHIRDTESPGGFFDEIIENAPRLSDQVGGLRDEHKALHRDSVALRAALGGETTPDFVGAAKTAASSLLDDLNAHHDVGAELLYECYWVDVATGD